MLRENIIARQRALGSAPLRALAKRIRRKRRKWLTLR